MYLIAYLKDKPDGHQIHSGIQRDQDEREKLLPLSLIRTDVTPISEPDPD